MRPVLVCAGIVAMLATSGCSGSNPQPDPTASPGSVMVSASPSGGVVDPTVPIPSSQAAGIPTADPSPTTTAGPTLLNASVLITLATADPDTGGLLLGGYVSGVMEDGGDCQYVVTPSGGNPTTLHKEGVENNGSTSCGSTTIAPSLAPPGSYTVVLRYENASGEVASEPVTVILP